MNKSILQLLVIFIFCSISNILSGCATAGFIIGVNTDWETKTTAVEADSLSWGENDFVEIETNDGSKLRGTVVAIERNKSVNLSIFRSNHKTIVIKWAEIKSVKLLETPYRKRFIGFSLSFLLDIGIMFLVVIGLSSAFGAIGAG